jgi:hypothetical protein
VLNRAPLHSGSEGLSLAARRVLLRTLSVSPDVIVQRYLHMEGMADLSELDKKLSRAYAFAPATGWLNEADAAVEQEITRRQMAAPAEGAVATALADVVGDLTRNRLTGEARLVALPEPEFLTALEYSLLAIAEVSQRQLVCRHLNGILHVRRLPYTLDHLETRFRWIGDPGEHDLAIGPALSALGDPRLAHARAEFDSSRDELRHGNLRDAANDAGCAVETAMSVLLDAHGHSQPSRHGAQRVQAGPLFDALVAVDLFERDRDRHLVFAAITVRDHGSHGVGATPRRLTPEYVKAGIASAGVAIAYIAAKLPPDQRE